MSIVPGSGAGAEQLTQLVERVERLEEEKRALMADIKDCLLYTSPSPRDGLLSRMPSSA